jgi:hypothetical protein
MLHGPEAWSRCQLRVVERFFPTHAAFIAAADHPDESPAFQASADQARLECHIWSAAEEQSFLAGTGQPGSKLHAHARCILRATERAYPTYAEWHTASEETTPDGDYTPEFLAKVDRIERECKHA